VGPDGAVVVDGFSPKLQTSGRVPWSRRRERERARWGVSLVSLRGRVGVVLEWRCWSLVGGERRWREKRREGEDLP
jgi:hypothetical protein